MSRLSLEPPVAELPGGRAVSHRDLLSLGAAAGAFALVVTSSGDAYVVAALLAVAAGDALLFVTAATVATAVLIRWGTSSLAALAGAQTVLGPAGATGSDLEVAASWCAGAALVAAGTTTPAAMTLTALAAAVVVAGPAATSATDLGVRAGAAGATLVVAAAVWRWAPHRWTRPAGVGLAGAAVVLAAAG